jgi:hypothetical protein
LYPWDKLLLKITSNGKPFIKRNCLQIFVDVHILIDLVGQCIFTGAVKNNWKIRLFSKYRRIGKKIQSSFLIRSSRQLTTYAGIKIDFFNIFICNASLI